MSKREEGGGTVEGEWRERGRRREEGHSRIDFVDLHTEDRPSLIAHLPRRLLALPDGRLVPVAQTILAL